ncbi:unnamed protein product [Polarella glacialis]|uniref:Cyclic nucleotide-binding domain-containing protein n=1 Tax=Polarella glacialis TaxID=89957 RepID=A0A813GUR7_POLGL|nr:unnamed protein product [Polarella glacialis]
MAQEHQEYIQSKVNPILESLVTEVLLERPDNPVPFMVRWLAERTKQGKDSLSALGVGEAEGLRVEIKQLQDEVKELSDKLASTGQPPAPKAAPPPAEDEQTAPKAAPPPAEDEKSNKDEKEGKQEKEEKEEEEEEESDDDFGESGDEADFKPPESYWKKGQRGSVSAEAFGAFNIKQAFEPTVHPKTPEQESRIKAVLLSSFLFNSLEKEDLEVIIGAMTEHSIAADQRIIQEGDDGDVMFLIESGAFDCLKKLEGVEKVVKKCGQGDVFGELALLYNCPRAASVQATESAVVWELDRATFNHIVRDASSKRREEYEGFLKAVPLLSRLEDYNRMQLADILQQETIEAGKAVVTQGESGEKFYMVQDGELVVHKSVDGAEAQEVLVYKRGDYFGELALIRNEVRAATVVAKTECRLASLNRKAFKSALGPLEGFMSEKAKEYA